MLFKILLLWSFVLLGRPQDLILALQPFRPALLLTAMSAGSAFFGGKGKQLSSVFHLSETRKYIFFYLTMILGIPFAYHRGEAFSFIFLLYSVNVLFFIIFIMEVDSIEKLKTILFMISLCTFFYGVFGLLNGAFYAGRFEIYGGMFDPNDIAYVLISLFPLSFYFIFHREGTLKRILAITSIITALIVILYSGSRGGMLGLIAVILCFLLTKTNKIKSSHKIVFIIGMTFLLFIVRDKIDFDRYLTLADVGNDYNSSDEFGRLQIWKRGFDLLLSNPITGVGVTCFGMALGYAREALGIVPKWQEPHNSFVQVSVETGVPGFILFMSLTIQSLKTFSKFKKLKSTSREIAELNTISGLMQVAFIGQLVAAAFITQAYSLFFTVFFAFSAVLGNIASRLTEQNVAN